MNVVCVPDDETAIRIVRTLRRINPHGGVIVRCRYQLNAEKLRHAGADSVVTEETEASHALLGALAAFQLASDDHR